MRPGIKHERTGFSVFTSPTIIAPGAMCPDKMVYNTGGDEVSTDCCVDAHGELKLKFPLEQRTLQI